MVKLLTMVSNHQNIFKTTLGLTMSFGNKYIIHFIVLWKRVWLIVFLNGYWESTVEISYVIEDESLIIYGPIKMNVMQGKSKCKKKISIRYIHMLYSYIYMYHGLHHIYTKRFCCTNVLHK